MKILKNKKAFTASILVDFWAYIIFALVALLFFILFSFGVDQKESQINAFQANTFSNYYSQFFLNKPIVVENKEMTVYDLIVLASTEAEGESKYKNLLENEAENFLKFMGDDVCSYIKIDGLDIEKLNCPFTDLLSIKHEVIRIATRNQIRTPIPVPDSSKKIELLLYYDLDSLIPK